MHILHVITGMRKAAGTSVFAGEVCNTLVAMGHEATIATCNPEDLDLYPLDPRVQLISIASLLSTPEPSTTHFNSLHLHALWTPILIKVAKWAHARKIPVVWSPHGMLTPWAMHNKRMKKLFGWWLYQRAALRAADLLHVTAQSEVEDVRRMGLTNPVVIAPLGVHTLPPSTSPFNSPSPSPQPSTFNLQPLTSRTLLFVSRVQRKKGLPNLLEAWAKLSRSLRDGWTIRIVGPDQDNHTAELMAQCTRLGLTFTPPHHASTSTPLFNSSPSTSPFNSPSPQVIFVGPLYGADLTREYGSADLFVLPTHSENFGSVVIESLAQGVPVICTKGAPWQELEEYHCGRWIDIGVEPLVAALTELLSLTPDERRALGANGLKLVQSKYTWVAVTQTLLDHYSQLKIADGDKRKESGRRLRDEAEEGG